MRPSASPRATCLVDKRSFRFRFSNGLNAPTVTPCDHSKPFAADPTVDSRAERCRQLGQRNERPVDLALERFKVCQRRSKSHQGLSGHFGGLHTRFERWNLELCRVCLSAHSRRRHGLGKQWHLSSLSELLDERQSSGQVSPEHRPGTTRDFQPEVDFRTPPERVRDTYTRMVVWLRGETAYCRADNCRVSRPRGEREGCEREAMEAFEAHRKVSSCITEWRNALFCSGRRPHEPETLDRPN